MKFSNEAKIGIMITAVIIILGYLTIKSGDFNVSKKGYTVKVRFTNIDGVSLNAPVMLNGLEVGKVNKIDIIEDKNVTRLELTVWVEERIKLATGTTAFAKNMGFFGEKYVGLLSASSANGYLQPDAVIEGRDPADVDRLLLDGQDIAKDIKSITSNLNERLTKNKDSIDRIVSNLDVSAANVNSITTNVDERIKVNQIKFDEMIANLHSSSTNLDQFTYDLKMNPWKLLYRSKEKRQKSIDLLKVEQEVKK